MDDAVVARKGSATTALVTQVVKSGAGGLPGDVTFQVDSVPADGSLIKLRGMASLEGDAKPPNAAVLIPVVGPLLIFKHGADAEIKAGTPFTAYVDADYSVAAAIYVKTGLPLGKDGVRPDGRGSLVFHGL